MILTLVGCASVVVALITAILRFYKGVFGAEGYLIQTLPVGKGAILLSKAITAYTLLFAGMLMAMLAVLGTLHLLDAHTFLQELNKELGGRFGRDGRLFRRVYAGRPGAEYRRAVFFHHPGQCQASFRQQRPVFHPLLLLRDDGSRRAGARRYADCPHGARIGADGVSFVFENMWGPLMDSMNASAAEGPALMNFTIGIGNLVMDLLLAAAFLVAAPLADDQKDLA